MLAAIGARFLPWLDEIVIPEAFSQLDRFTAYVGRWRDALDV